MATPNQTINYGTTPPVKDLSGSRTAGAIGAPVTPAVKGMPPTPSRTAMPVTPMPTATSTTAPTPLNPVIATAVNRQPAAPPMPVTTTPPTAMPQPRASQKTTPPTAMPVTPMPPTSAPPATEPSASTTGTTPDNPQYSDWLSKNPAFQNNPQLLSQMQNWFNSTPDQQLNLITKLFSDQSAASGGTASTDGTASTGGAGPLPPTIKSALSAGQGAMGGQNRANYIAQAQAQDPNWKPGMVAPDIAAQNKAYMDYMNTVDPYANFTMNKAGDLLRPEHSLGTSPAFDPNYAAWSQSPEGQAALAKANAYVDNPTPIDGYMENYAGNGTYSFDKVPKG